MRPRSDAKVLTDAFRAELLKLVTLPAIQYTVIGTWAVTALITIALVNAGQDNADLLSGPVPAGFVVLGLLSITSEYQGGQIRTTLVAVPRRITAYVAKLAAVVVVTAPVAGTTVAVNALIGGRADSWAIGYLTVTALIAQAVGAVLRRTVPALVGLLSYYFVIGPLVRDPFAQYLPDGRNWWALSVWGAGVTTVALAAFHTRDAER